jgi:hypothetical protein
MSGDEGAADIRRNIVEIDGMLRKMPKEWSSQLRSNRSKLRAAGALLSEIPPEKPTAHSALLALNLNNRGEVSSEAGAGQEPATGVAVPQEVRAAAMAGLRESYRWDKGSGYGGYDFIGIARAIQLSVSPKISREAQRRMRMYFDRKYTQDRLSEQYAARQGKRYMSWLNWGGDPGARWSGSKCLDSGAVPSRDNPKERRPFQAGDQLFWRRPGAKREECVVLPDSVQGQDPSQVMVRWGRGNWDFANAKDLERMGPMEELAALGKTLKNPKSFKEGDRLFWKRGDGPRKVCLMLPAGEQGRNPSWKMVKDLDTGIWFCADENDLEAIGPLEEFALLAKKKKTFPEAKYKVLQSLAGLPARERLDGKCLLANTTLCGLAGGRLVVGTATHKTEGRVLHVWVVDDQGRIQDALEHYYSKHQEDPSRARDLGEAWQAAQETVHDVASGTDVIREWRRYRGV